MVHTSPPSIIIENSIPLFILANHLFTKPRFVARYEAVTNVGYHPFSIVDEGHC